MVHGWAPHLAMVHECSARPHMAKALSLVVRSVAVVAVAAVVVVVVVVVRVVQL